LVCSYSIAASAVEVSIPSLIAEPGETITIPISVDDAKGIAGGDIILAFDQDNLTAKEAQATELAASLNFMPNLLADEITISMAGTNGIPEGSGVLIEIIFEVSAAAKVESIIPLTLKEVAFYDELGNDIPVTIVNGSVTINIEKPPIVNGRRLIIPELTAEPGDTIIVPINITDAAGAAGGDIAVTYDKNVITVKESRSTALSSGMNLIHNIETPGEIVLSMAGTKSIPEGSGALVEIVFEVSTTAKTETKVPLTFVDVALYDELGNEIEVQFESGLLTIESQPSTPEYPRWDVNQDGVVDISDLVLVVIHFGEDYRAKNPILPNRRK